VLGLHDEQQGASVGMADSHARLDRERNDSGRREEFQTMKRGVCSYDMFAVPDPSFVLKDTVGELYFGTYDASPSGRYSVRPSQTSPMTIERGTIRCSLQQVKSVSFPALWRWQGGPLPTLRLGNTA
jgi:hypothetical protein